MVYGQPAELYKFFTQLCVQCSSYSVGPTHEKLLEKKYSSCAFGTSRRVENVSFYRFKQIGPIAFGK